MKPYGIIAIAGALTVAPCQAQEFTLHEDDYAERGKQYSPYVDEHFPQNVYFGDTHLHTSWSADAGLAGEGAIEYGACMGCHGSGVIAAGMAPDLRASQIVLNDASFAAVVRDGTNVSRGMPAHPQLTDVQLTALQHYIRQRARDTL